MTAKRRLLATLLLSLASASPAPTDHAQASRVPGQAIDGAVAPRGAGAPRTRARPAPPSAERDAFERARRSVFLVETESGHGSGFLVHAAGLVVTNDHVLGRSRYVAVALDPARKYPAVTIARDAARDVALLRVHPRAVERLTPLPFIDAHADVAVGERVLAIGSALTDEGVVLTTGIVSRVTADTIIADITVNPGSSGGPLIDLHGQVLGIQTFWQRAPAGPGLAGIVRAHVAMSLLSGAMATLLSATAPRDECLPVAPPLPYPAHALRERAAALRDPSAYGRRLGGMRVDVLTPPLVYHRAHEARFKAARKEKVRGEHAVEADAAGRTWQAQTGHVEAIVGIRARPDIAVSIEAPGHGPLGAPGEAARGERFKTSFREMRLLRAGVEVVPIVPGRFCGPAPSGAEPSQPDGCFGLYQYRPEAFAPGAPLELHVYREDSPATPFIWRLPPALVDRVWADFEPCEGREGWDAGAHSRPDAAWSGRVDARSSEVREYAPDRPICVAAGLYSPLNRSPRW
jgi:hypothetical protein